MKYEEKILEFLDGSLSDSESAELLHALSVSPEKRVILEQHIQLKDIITSAQKPIAVPSEIEQAMSRKFPIIPTYTNEVMTGSSIVERSVIKSFFQKRTVRYGAAALLLLAFSTYFAVSSRNSNVGDGSGGPEAVKNAPIVHSTDGSEMKVTPVEPSAYSSTSITTASSAVKNETVINNTAHRASHTTTNPKVITNTNLSQNNKVIGVDTDKEAVLPESSNTVNANANDVSHLTEIALISSVSTPRTDPSPSIARNSIGQPNYKDPFFKQSEPSNFPLSLRVEGVLGNAYFRVNEGGSVQSTRIETRPLLGADLIVSPYFSIGVEGSSAGIAKVVPSQIYKAEENITRSVTSNTIEATDDYYARAMFRYTINPYDMFRVETSIGGGVAFDGTTTPLVASSVAVTTSVSKWLGFSAGIAFAGTFSEVSSPVTSGVEHTQNKEMPIGYITESAPASTTLFSPSLTLRAGFRIKPW
jgi:hypothetical protein